MAMMDLMHKKIVLGISDPWDLGEQLGWPELEAAIVDIKFDDDMLISVIIKLSDPFKYKNLHCEYFIVSPRLEGGSFSQIQSRSGMFSGMTRIPPDQVGADDPFDLSYWRGGVSLIGNIMLARG
jgi:hypothetical protein